VKTVGDSNTATGAEKITVESQQVQTDPISRTRQMEDGKNTDKEKSELEKSDKMEIDDRVYFFEKIL